MTRKVIDREKRSKRLSEIQPGENGCTNSDFCRDKSHAEGSPCYTKTARPCICVIESFRIKGI